MFRALIPRARIVGADPLVLTDELGAVLESTFGHEQLDANPVLRERLHRPRRLRGTYMALLNPWCYNHFHWILDTLPRASLLPLSECADLPVIVPRRLSRAQLDALPLVGIEEDRLLGFDHTNYHVDQLIFPSFVGRTGSPPRWAPEWLRERLAPVVESRRRKLWISRTHGGRTVANEASVVAALLEQGLEVVRPEVLSLRDQLQVFAEGELIVGVHGAGLANVIAARRATVVELFPTDYVNAYYYAPCDALGHRYWYLLCDAADGDSNMTVNLDLLQQTVATALAQREH